MTAAHDTGIGALPPRLPHVSPGQLGALRGTLALLQRISPRSAASLALHVFLRPYRRSLRPEDIAGMTGARRHTVHAGPDSVAVYEWPGAQRTALILHGWGSRAGRFAAMAGLLQSRGWRVLVLDAPGHGLSPGRSSSLPQFMRALDAVATNCGPVHALIGHSLGALAIACRHAAGPPPWAASLRATVLVSMPSGAPFLVESFLMLLGIGAGARSRWQQAFQARFGASPEEFTTLPGAARIASRLLVVHDAGDDIVPCAHSTALMPSLPAGSRLLVTQDQGHSALTRDAGTLDAIAAFLEEPR